MSTDNDNKNAVSGVIETLKTNPKALAAAGVAVALVLFLVLKGGGNEGEKPAKVAAVSVGQTVTIHNPNVGNTLLLAAPGAVGMADSESDKDDSVVCRVVVAGTTAKVEEESTVNYIPFVKVTLNDGDCAGKTGWLPKVNIQ